ncbi:alpha/beta hydrolase-fold protein [Aurantibacillus circumpalustris]|uniref:alpha/beta hydrolase-fold protein n=1 Tax=Aurantibacillus circumpalustris TaxID=3036359 RepID=UPI00295C0EE8|nr:alpha/beta hydrolase-fold protein [Aurantibacillus circumpalustris]
MARFFCSIILFTCITSLTAQVAISGRVIDPLSQEALAFVNIGIKNKNIGTTSLSDGSFSINIPGTNQFDSLTFSLIGYSELKIPITQSAQKLIPLFRKSAILEEVAIKTSKLKEKTFGLKRHNFGLHFIDGSINANDIVEIAQLIKLPATLTKLTSVNLYMSESSDDSISFRVNFYTYQNNRPAERLLEKQIILTQNIQEGWLRVDVSKFNIYAKEKIICAIEFLPAKTREKRISYDVKLGGTSKSFLRKNSLGEWTVPPHHYMMNVTAYDSNNKESYQETEEKEDIATTTLFSKFVKDTFSIFVSLPSDYYKSKNKTYPLVYLLDANAYFNHIKEFLLRKENDKLQKTILIGIGYSDAFMMDSLRQRDYTFPKTDSCNICGGANNFRSFIQKELVPYIQKNYRCKDNNATLMGHSLGGYFPFYALYKDLEENNTFFQNYIAISPSLEYSNNYLIDRFANYRPEKTLDKKVYSVYGDKEENNPEDDLKNLYIFQNFTSHLKTYSHIQIKAEVYPKLEHMETAIPGFEKGLRLLLNTK